MTSPNISRTIVELYNEQGFLIVATWGEPRKKGDIINLIYDAQAEAMFRHPFRVIEEVTEKEMLEQGSKMGKNGYRSCYRADNFYKIITD